MSRYLIDYILFALLFSLFLGPPIYLWIKWIKIEIRNKSKFGQLTSIFSFLLFSSIIYTWIGPDKPFEHNTVRLTNSGAISFFLLILSFVIPSIYFYSRWIYKAIQLQKPSTILFRFSFLLLLVLYFFYQSIDSKLESLNGIGKNLGVNIPYWGTSFKSFENNISSFRSEGEVNATLILSNKSVDLLTDQIVSSKFYNRKNIELVYSDNNNWSKQDSVKYWSIRSYLQKNKLTGLWMYNSQKAIYEFYEPNLSDIPNAGILFHEDYSISAEFDPETKTLIYRKSQF